MLCCAQNFATVPPSRGSGRRCYGLCASATKEGDGVNAVGDDIGSDSTSVGSPYGPPSNDFLRVRLPEVALVILGVSWSELWRRRFKAASASYENVT